MDLIALPAKIVAFIFAIVFIFGLCFFLVALVIRGKQNEEEEKILRGEANEANVDEGDV